MRDFKPNQEATIVKGFTYEWETSKSKLDNRLFYRGGGETWTYDPLVETPDLWTQLARLPQHEKPIAEFARSHGDFGIEPRRPLPHKALGWTLRELRREITLFQKAFDEWHEHQRQNEFVPRKLEAWATPVLRETYFVLTVRGVFPSAWLMLGNAIYDRRQTGSCLVCPNVFELKAQGKPRKFCSEKCKKRYQRRSKE